MNIELSPETYQRLESIMLPYENPELVIRRLLDSVGEPDKSKVSVSNGEVAQKPDTEKEPSIDATRLRDLLMRTALTPRSTLKVEYTEEDKAKARQYRRGDHVPSSHVKIIEAIIDGKPEAKNWDAIIKRLLRLIHGKGHKINNDLHKKLRIRPDAFHDHGYKYLPDIDVSVQGANGANAGRIVMDLAAEWEIPVEVFFGWYLGRNGAYPGEYGLIKI